MIWNELSQFWVLPLMLDFNSCYATVKQRFWRAMALASASFKRSCSGIPKGCCSTPGVRCSQPISQPVDGTRFNTSRGIYVSSPCFVHEKSGCPTTSIYLIYTAGLLHGQPKNFLDLLEVSSSPWPHPAPPKNHQNPPATRRPPYPWLNGEWTGVNRRNPWEF